MLAHLDQSPCEVHVISSLCTWYLHTFTFQSSSHKPLYQLEPNVVEMLFGWDTICVLFFFDKKDPKLSLSELLSMMTRIQYNPTLFIWPSMWTRLEHAHCLETIKHTFTFQSSSHKPLYQLEPNVVEMLFGWSSMFIWISFHLKIHHGC
jgi:uncharacterized protein YdeI (YjbR/CyaY-like superfamily)